MNIYMLSTVYASEDAHSVRLLKEGVSYSNIADTCARDLIAKGAAVESQLKAGGE